MAAPHSPHPLSEGPLPLHIDMACPGGGAVVVTPAGELDFCTGPQLGRVLAEVAAVGPVDLTVNLDELSFMDGTILRVLADAKELTARAGGSIRVRCHNDIGRRLLSLADLVDLLDEG